MYDKGEGIERVTSLFGALICASALTLYFSLSGSLSLLLSVRICVRGVFWACVCVCVPIAFNEQNNNLFCLFGFSLQANAERASFENGFYWE